MSCTDRCHACRRTQTRGSVLCGHPVDGAPAAAVRLRPCRPVGVNWGDDANPWIAEHEDGLLDELQDWSRFDRKK
jgi:hypothetical protein